MDATTTAAGSGPAKSHGEPLYRVTDRLHNWRTVQVPGHQIASTVSAWLAELGADSPLVDDLARAACVGDWAAAYAAHSTGKLQLNTRKCAVIDSVFWATKTSKIMRIARPTTSAHHAAASRVNDERVVRAVVTLESGGWGGTGGSVFMLMTSR